MTGDEFEAWLGDAFAAFRPKAEATDASCAPYPEREYDLHNGTLTFFEDGVPRLRARIQVVGTTGRSDWLWAWANERLPRDVIRDAEAVRRFGEDNGVEWFSEERFEPQQLEAFGWEMTIAAAKIAGAVGATAVPYGDGGRQTFFLLHDLRRVEPH